MGYLSDAFENLKIALTPTWTDVWNVSVVKDDTTDIDYVSDIELQITTQLNPVVNAFYENLNLSILCGEYVLEITAYKERLTAIEEYIRNNIAYIELPSFPAVSAMAQDLVETNFYRPVHDSLRNYQMLLDVVEQHLVYKNNTSTIFRLLKDEVQMGKDTDSTIRELASLFRLNVKLSEIDHTISLTEQDFTSLLLSQERLKTVSATTSSLNIISKKCEFLLYKLSFRLQQSQQNYLYAIDFNYSTVEPKEIAEFDSFNAIIKGHYDIGNKPPLYKHRFERALIRYEQAGNLSFDDYHALTKYFKDETKDIQKLNELLKRYKELYERESPTASPFNKRAFDITYCYLENNILSLELDLGEFNLENWQSKLRSYTERADTFKNKNFFPYYKIINKFLGEQITKLFSSKTNNLLILNKLIHQYEVNLSNLIKNVGICEETDYLAFQNDYAGGMVSIEDNLGQSRDCFIASSYVLPLNYKEIREELEIYKAELNKFKSMYGIQELIDADRKDVQAVKHEIEKTDKRHIEILSIFAALVMFVSNTIQIFSKATNFTDAVTYTLFFAYALGLFVLMIWFITRPEGVSLANLKFTHKFTFFIFL